MTTSLHPLRVRASDHRCFLNRNWPIEKVDNAAEQKNTFEAFCNDDGISTHKREPRNHLFVFVDARKYLVLDKNESEAFPSPF